MNNSPRKRFATILVVTVLATLVAFSTTATAAMLITGKQIKDHSVTGKDIKKHTLKAKHLKKRAIKSKQVKKRAIKSAHLKDGAVHRRDLHRGAVGAKQLRNGSITLNDLDTTVVNQLNGASGFEVVTKRVEASVPILAPVSTTASCPAGKVAIGADGWWDGNTNLAPPQVRRTSKSSYAAESAFPLDVLGGQTLVLSMSCVSVR